MAEVTVKELADLVGTPVEKLLKQMKDAGLVHESAEQSVKDEEKQQLLSFLKRSHGESEAASTGGRITLQRKSVSQLKLSGSQGKTKTVSVEVRKKRTYVKRSTLEISQPELEESKTEEFIVESEAPIAEVVVSAVPAQQDLVHQTKEDDDYVHAAPIESPKSARTAKKVGTSKNTASAKDLLSAKLHDDGQKLKKEEQRKREEEAKRKSRSEAEDKARQRTLEEARRIASELEHRPVVAQEEEAVDNADRLVRQAFEESIVQEEKRARRTIRKPIAKAHKAKAKGGAQHGFMQPTQPMIKEVQLGSTITVADLANQMSIKSHRLIKALMAMGVVATINQPIDQDIAVLVIEELGHKYTLVNEDALEHALAQQHTDKQSSEDLKSRAPVVTIMGHVDHGKTSLLDYIRRTKVAAGEAGGITQHIGAYHVETEKGMITFLDTPGHAAFTAMRARGAQSTDIVILVVAADDGLMPQTEEAIDHARAAGVPIIVAVNKMDKEGADLDRVTNELAMRKELLPEAWGGETPFLPVSAHTGEGIDALLDAILLQAEILELTAATEGPAKGVVIESRLDKGRGPVVSLLVQSGCLRLGDIMLAGSFYGRVRAMVNENGRSIEAAGPSIPIEVLGLVGVPEAGDVFLVVPDERTAREVSEFRNEKERNEKMARHQKTSLENAFDNLKSDQKAKINIVLKTDVRGSLEALHGALSILGNDEVRLNVVGSGVGGISETDANLALTSGAVLIGFNVRADNTARKIAQDGGIEIRYYSVIYNIIEDMKAALSGLLKPERQEDILGVAEVRDVFHSSKFGAAAGCMVLEGSLFRNKRIRVLRKEVVIFEGELESLRRFKDDVAEVRNGMECGLAVRSYNDVKVGDKIEAYSVKEIARSL